MNQLKALRFLRNLEKLVGNNGLITIVHKTEQNGDCEKVKEHFHVGIYRASGPVLTASDYDNLGDAVIEAADWIMDNKEVAP